MSLGMLFALGSALIWSTSSLMIKANAGQVDTLSFNAFRVTIGALFFWLLVPFLGGAGLLAGMGWPTFLALTGSMILGFCIGDTVYFWSMTKIGASRTMPISGVFPVFTWLLAVPILGEQVTTPAIIGTVLVIVALFLLAHEHPTEIAESNELLITAPQDGTPPEGINQRTRYLAIGAALLAAFMWACSTTLLRLGIQFQQPVTLYETLQQSIMLGAVRMTIALAILVPFTTWFKGVKVWKVYHGPELPGLVGLGIYSTGIGSLLFSMGVALAGAARAALLNAASPLLGVVFSWLFLREPMTRRIWVGTGLALAGVWLVLS